MTGAGATPTGSVSFYDGKTLLKSVQLNANGVAVFTTSGLTGGNHSITAVYTGDANYVSGVSLPLLQHVEIHIGNRLV